MSTHDRLIWQGFPAWSKFAWLYLASFVAGSRGLRILWQGTTKWAGWLAGAVALLCAPPVYVSGLSILSSRTEW